jgi:hypothetical protein
MQEDNPRQRRRGFYYLWRYYSNHRPKTVVLYFNATALATFICSNQKVAANKSDKIVSKISRKC